MSFFNRPAMAHRAAAGASSVHAPARARHTPARRVKRRATTPNAGTGDGSSPRHTAIRHSSQQQPKQHASPTMAIHLAAASHGVWSSSHVHNNTTFWKMPQSPPLAAWSGHLLHTLALKVVGWLGLLKASWLSMETYTLSKWWHGVAADKAAWQILGTHTKQSKTLWSKAAGLQLQSGFKDLSLKTPWVTPKAPGVQHTARRR